MTATPDQTTDVPVRKTITVKASAERAFHVFTAELDGWWPRSHHIGKAPMKKAILEGGPAGGATPNRPTAPSATGAQSSSGSRRGVW